MIAFKYYKYPELFINFKETECSLCQTNTQCISARDMNFGEYVEDKGYISPDENYCVSCIKDFKLEEKYTEKNNKANRHCDTYYLEQDLQNLYPEKSIVQIEDEALKLKRVIQYATPPVYTLQDYDWPHHCGDFCAFYKYAGKSELNEIAPDGNGEKYALEHIENWNPSVWNHLTEAPLTKDNFEKNYMGLYIFECVTCKTYKVLWDQS